MDVRGIDDEVRLVDDESYEPLKEKPGEAEFFMEDWAKDGFFMEDWAKDGFDSYEQYEEWYCDLIDDMFDESKEAWQPVKKGWHWANKRYEMEDTDDSSVKSSPTRSRLPMLHHAIEEAVATLVENWPRPSIVSRQATQDDFASGISYYISESLDANGFDMLWSRMVLDAQRMFLGVIKVTVDDSQLGPLGNQGKIVIKNIDPRYVWFDPYARSYNWEDMRYLVVAEPYDISDIQMMFPARGEYVKGEQRYSLNRRDDEKDDPVTGSGEWWSPFSENEGSIVLGQRKRALVKELWLKDDRLERGPDGFMRKRFPHGRVLISAGGVLLADMPNPYRHRRPPYVFLPSRLSPKLMAYSNLELLARIEDKVNILHTDMLRNARANMNSPWITDTKTFSSREMYKRLSSNPGEVIVTNPGTRIDRMPPGDIPGFVLPLIEWLSGVFDDVLGIQDIMRGGLQKGMQISAEAVSGLQGAATARVRLKARIMESSLKELGYQMQWLIRQTYPSEMKVQIIDPKDQKQKTIYWSNNDQQPDFPVAIEAGASIPGAKQGTMQQALVLYQNNLIDRKAALAAFGIPNAAAIDERMTKKENLELELDVQKRSKNPNPSGRPGRKNSLPKNGV